MRVLVVDDSAVIRSRLVPLLRDIQGVTEVDEAAGCGAAQEAVDRREPDLIILDIQMPDGNGIELLCTLRQQGVASSVIVFTNYPVAHYRDASLKAGALNFFDKSADVDCMLKIVSALAAGDPGAGWLS